MRNLQRWGTGYQAQILLETSVGIGLSFVPVCRKELKIKGWNSRVPTLTHMIYRILSILWPKQAFMFCFWLLTPFPLHLGRENITEGEQIIDVQKHWNPVFILFRTTSGFAPAQCSSGQLKPPPGRLTSFLSPLPCSWHLVLQVSNFWKLTLLPLHNTHTHNGSIRPKVASWHHMA